MIEEKRYKINFIQDGIIVSQQNFRGDYDVAESFARKVAELKGVGYSIDEIK